MLHRMGLLLLLLCATVGGCFGETSFPLRPEHEPLPRGQTAPPEMAAREWLTTWHQRLADRLPETAREGLTTEAVSALPEAKAVYDRFGRNGETVSSPLHNLGGILATAAVAKGDAASDNLDGPEPPAWPGFRSVWVPGVEGAELFGRFGQQRDANGRPISADAVVIAVGFLGNLGGYRYRDLSAALYARGFHVLALEMRGHGQTGLRRADQSMTFGVLESLDLLSAAAWLRAQGPSQRVSLIGFSWGATDALVAAWLDGDRRARPSRDPIWQRVPWPSSRPILDGGVLAIAPVLDMERTTASFDEPAALVADPVRHFVQDAMQSYLRLHGADPARIDHRAASFIDFEYGRTRLSREYADLQTGRAEGFAFLELLGSAGRLKCEQIRVPTLVVHCVDDPLSPADTIAALPRGVSNPNLAVLVLPAGGHGGLPVVSASYYYGLILAFLERPTAPAPARIKG